MMKEQPKKEVFTMQDFKDLLWRLTVTAIIWIVSRFIPAMIPVIFQVQVNGIVSVLIMLGALYLSWYIAGTVSKWKYPGTIETNLIILGTIECLSLVVVILGLIANFADIANLNVPLFLITLLVSGFYIWLCFILRNEAKERYKVLYGSDKT